MSLRGRKFPLRHPVVVDVGCSCRRPKLSSLFSFSSLRSKARKVPDAFSPSATSTTSLWDTSAAGATTTATTSDASPPPRRRRRRPRSKEEESVAVVKESSEPYLDFKESMLQMIVENEMYGWDELNHLLHRLLALNSPDTHPLILRAFADIWKAILAPSDD